MDTVWDIPPQEGQETYVLFEEGQESYVPHSAGVEILGTFDMQRGIHVADSGQIEIVEADKLVHFRRNELQATVGSIRGVVGDESQLVLGSDLGAHYVGRFKRMLRPDVGPLRGRATFVTTSLLHKGTYLFKQLRVEFRRDPNTEEWRIPVRLPLIRIHRPHRDGCTAEMAIRASGKTEGSATFEFLGIKGGGGQGVTIELSTRLKAGSICKEETIPATLVVEHGATLVNDQAVAYGARYRIVEVDPSYRKTRRVPPEIDSCGKVPSPVPRPKPRFWATFDKTDIPSGDSNSDDEGVKVGSTDYVSVGLGAEAGSVPLKLALEMKRTMEWEFDMKTTLAGGAKYLRYPVGLSTDQLPFEICWSVLS